jgi:hypothetical protein
MGFRGENREAAQQATPCLQQLSRQQSVLRNLTISRALGLIHIIQAERFGERVKKEKSRSTDVSCFPPLNFIASYAPIHPVSRQSRLTTQDTALCP